MASEYIPAFPITHDFHKSIYWDRTAKEYYNKQTDIYLSNDDAKYYALPLPRENGNIGILFDLKLYILRQNIGNLENCLRDQWELSRMKNNPKVKFHDVAQKTYMTREWLKSYTSRSHFSTIDSFFNLDLYL